MIFMIDGIGKMAMDAILMRDYPVVQAYVVWTALIFTCVNLVTDLLLHQLEPAKPGQGFAYKDRAVPSKAR